MNGGLEGLGLELKPITFLECRRAGCFKLPTWGGIMSELYWLTDAQIERLRPFFPKSRGRPRADDLRVLSGIIFIQRNGLM